MNLILDLDNTLIFSSTKYQKNSIKFLNYYIKPRPGLQSFLKKVNEKFNVSVWTAAEQEYANFVVNTFLKGIPIHYVFSRQDGVHSMNIFGTKKDIRLLKEVYNIPLFKNKTIIVDDLQEVCSKQSYNCINIKPYNGENNDNELSNVLNILNSI